MARVHPSLFTAALLIFVAGSGCVLPEPEGEASSAGTDEPTASGSGSTPGAGASAGSPGSAEPAAPAPEPNMTAEVTRDDSGVGLCLTTSLRQLYCAHRDVWVEGIIQDVKVLPVLLESFRGTLQVTTTEGEDWYLHASFSASGMSSREAEENLEAIRFEWSHEGDDGYALTATAVAPEDLMSEQQASFTLVLPKALAVDVETNVGTGSILIDSLSGGNVAASASASSIYLSDLSIDIVTVDVATGSLYATNITADSVSAEAASGSIHADEITSRTTELHTSSGSLYAEISGESASLSSSSGNLYVTFVATGSGTLALDGGAASLDLVLPEDDAHGYRLAAEAGSGSIDVLLDDGTLTVDEDDRTTFVTSDFEGRDIQTGVDLHTGSGSIRVYPLDE